MTGRTGKLYPQLTCVNCGETKRATRFPKRGGLTYENLPQLDPRRYDTQCKLCKKPKPVNAGSDYVHKEPKIPDMGRPKKKPSSRKRLKETARGGKAQVRIDTRIKSMLYLAEKGCCKCGERDPRKLEYDHKDPSDKHRGISRLIVDGYSWASAVLRAEIRKCRVLCANCHRVHTIKQQGYYASAAVRATLRAIADTHGFEP
jgi:hypothetical protein